MSFSNPVAAALFNAPGAPPPPLFAGDPAPWFAAPSDIGQEIALSSLGGRWVLLALIDGLATAEGSRTVAALTAEAARFIPLDTALLLVTRSAADHGAALPPGAAGMRILFDPDGAIAALYGAKGPVAMFLLDPQLRIAATLADRPCEAQTSAALALFDRRPRTPAPAPAASQAPVLLVDHVFEPDFCARLISGHEADGGAPTGFMVDRDGATIEVRDGAFKRRTDWIIADEAIRRACRARIQRRLVPAIRRAFQFDATRVERYLVARYDGESKGHFAPHRDNTTKGTAHRRFAVSINLNADFDGGDLAFPEFGPALFKPPVGGACVFSCSLLHQALPVTRGRRYVFVPFLYDEAAAALREP